MSTTHDNYDPEKQENTPYSNGKDQTYAFEVAPAGGVVHDAVFGDMSDDGPNYRSVGRG